MFYEVGIVHDGSLRRCGATESGMHSTFLFCEEG